MDRRIACSAVLTRLLFYLKKFLRRHHMVRENGTDHKNVAPKICQMDGAAMAHPATAVRVEHQILISLPHFVLIKLRRLSPPPEVTTYYPRLIYVSILYRHHGGSPFRRRGGG